MRSSLVGMCLIAGSLAGAQAHAGSFGLNLTADGSSRYYEHFSGVYAQIDQGFNGDPALDGFFLIGTGRQVGTGADVFPFEGAFSNIGSISYNAAGLSGTGVESAAITGLTLNVNPYIDPDFLGIDNYTTTVNSFSGSLTLFNGAVAGIDMISAVTFTLHGAVPARFSGAFNIDVNAYNYWNKFSLDVDDTFASPFGPVRLAWDVTGSVNNLTAVPVPGAAILFSTALAMAGFMRRRTNVAAV